MLYSCYWRQFIGTRKAWKSLTWICSVIVLHLYKQHAFCFCFVQVLSTLAICVVWFCMMQQLNNVLTSEKKINFLTCWFRETTIDWNAISDLKIEVSCYLFSVCSQGKRGVHIPYRNSKITRILQSSLGGNARTAIICTLSPAISHVEQSRNTLFFATCAKEVTNSAQVNVVCKILKLEMFAFVQLHTSTSPCKSCNKMFFCQSGCIRQTDG